MQVLFHRPSSGTLALVPGLVSVVEETGRGSGERGEERPVRQVLRAWVRGHTVLRCARLLFKQLVEDERVSRELLGAFLSARG